MSPPLWLSADALMSSYNLPKGETKAEFKHKPQMLRVEGPGGASITEPVSPQLNVGAVVHLLLERFLAAKSGASPALPSAAPHGTPSPSPSPRLAVCLFASLTYPAAPSAPVVSTDEEYGLYLQPSEGKSDEGVWLKDTAKLHEYDLSKGRLVLRLKQIPTKVMFSDESFRVFMFDRGCKVRTAIDQVCDTISMREKAGDYGLLLLRGRAARSLSQAPPVAATTTSGGALEASSERDHAPKWLKDTKTLEYYKIDANSTLKLQLKPKIITVHLCVSVLSVYLFVCLLAVTFLSN